MSNEIKSALTNAWYGVYSSEPWLDLITNFVGMPFFHFNKSDPKIKKFFLNLSEWDADRFLLLINIVRSFFICLLNLFLIVPKFILNVFKLVTEFIPLFLMVLTRTLGKKLWSNLSSSRPIISTLICIPLFLGFVVFCAVWIGYVVGRAITSPHTSLYAAWKAGEEWVGKGPAGKAVGVVLCALSLAVTIFSYLILFPIGVKLAVTYMPAIVVSKIQAVLNFFAALSKVGAPLSVIMNPIFQALGPFFAQAGSGVLFGMAVVTGLVAGPAALLLHYISDKIDAGLAEVSTRWRRKFGSPVQKPVKKVELNKKPKPKQQRAPAQPIVAQEKKVNQENKQQKKEESQRRQEPPPAQAGKKKQPPAQVRPQQVFWKEPKPEPKAPTKQALKEEKPKAANPINKILKKDLTIDWGRKLGEGGFGAVYYGSYQYKGESKAVAIKVSSQSFQDDKTREEMKREMEAMARASSSPHIVHFYGFCAEEVGIVMEYMAQGSLFDVLHSKNKPCPPERTCYQMGLDAGKGIAYLHKEGIIHADLKSLNVLVNEKCEAKISDLGLSKITQRLQPNRTAITLQGPSHGDVGTICWMAPELFEDNPRTTPKSDVYSYGVILWEVYAKKIPFKDCGNLGQVVVKVKEGNRDLIPTEMPPTMKRFTRTCWSLAPENRPEMKEVVEGLEKEFGSYRFR